MNIEEFVSEENHMCNLGQDLFCEIFEPGAIYARIFFARSSNPERFMICRIAILIKKSFTGSVSTL